MARSSRDDIVLKAHDLFYERGFHAVGLEAILRAVGVTKTTFYNHFDSKEDLVAEVLRYHDRWWREEFRQMLRKKGGDRPRDQLEAIPAALDALFTRRDYNGCFFVNVAVQFPQPQDPSHRAAAAHKSAMSDLLREIAGYAGAEDPAALARDLALVMEGAYVTAQIHRGVPEAWCTRDLVALLLAKHLPAPKNASGEG